MSFVQSMAGLLLSASLLMQQTLMTLSPQNDPDGLLLVNREWKISSEYYPLVREANVQGQVKRLRPEVAAALEEMFKAAKAEARVTLVSVSGYREYDKQERIYKAKLKRVRGDVEAANAYVAPPGTSEHQTGLTMDVGMKKLSSDQNLSASFGGSTGGIWLRENCWRFGFVIRYQEGWEEITGYSPEPWHIRYVGKEYAEKLHENNMPLEVFLQLLREDTLLRLLALEE